MKHSIYRKNVFFFLVGLVYVLVMLSPSISNANTFYVSKTGNDANPGTNASSFQSIKRGVSQLSAGDTLYVKSGTYNESILSWETTIQSGSSWNNPVTVAVNPGDVVTINPPSGHAFFWVKDGEAKYLIIDGFIIDGKHKAKYGFKFADNSRYIRVQNTEIKNSTDSGLLVSICSGCQSPGTAPRNTYHEFINLNVHHNGSSHFDHGFYIESAHNIIEKSTIHHNQGYGGHIYRSTINTADYNIIRQNTFHDNNTAGEWGCGLILSSGKGNVAYNNIAYGNFAGFCIQSRATNAHLYNNISYQNDNHGIYVGHSSNTDARVENNTVYKNGTYGVFVGDGSKNAVIENNIAYQNSTSDIYLAPAGQSGTIKSHNLTENPLFVNENAKDFRLQANSILAIDKGLARASTEVTKDYDGVSRNTGRGPDIGAFEFLQSGPDNTPPGAVKKVVIEEVPVKN